MPKVEPNEVEAAIEQLASARANVDAARGNLVAFYVCAMADESTTERTRNVIGFSAAQLSTIVRQLVEIRDHVDEVVGRVPARKTKKAAK